MKACTFVSICWQYSQFSFSTKFILYSLEFVATLSCHNLYWISHKYIFLVDFLKREMECFTPSFSTFSIRLISHSREISCRSLSPYLPVFLYISWHPFFCEKARFNIYGLYGAIFTLFLLAFLMNSFIFCLIAKYSRKLRVTSRVYSIVSLDHTSHDESSNSDTIHTLHFFSFLISGRFTTWFTTEIVIICNRSHQHSQVIHRLGYFFPK